MEKDTLFAGYFKLKVWCSSTSNDMALRVNVRGVDEKGVEVPFDVQFTYPKMPWEKNHFPAATGALKVSHRKQDMEKATEYRPYHTHKREDCQLLKSNEVVECEVEIAPTTMQLKKGWRLRIDLLSEKDIVDSSYQKGAVNKIYSGDKYESYLQMPVIK